MKEYEPREDQFEKTNDYLYEFHGYHTPGGVCRIRIYEKPADTPVIIATELPDNPNTSVTNMAEYLAAEIIAKHFPQRFEEERPVTWIEHYPPIEVRGKRGKKDEYSVVEFSSYTPRREYTFGQPRVRIGEPSWRHIDEDDLTRLLGQHPS